MPRTTLRSVLATLAGAALGSVGNARCRGQKGPRAPARGQGRTLYRPEVLGLL